MQEKNIMELQMENIQNLPLHHCHLHKVRAIVNRLYTFFNILAILAILCYRGSYFFHKKDAPLLPWLVIFAAEILLSLTWIIKQPVFWWPITRTVFPERLPKDESLPGLDVFICTADPNKEPTFKVMNTVISAMTLDYPAEKLSVYLSDDGGAAVTLNGIKEAWAFATWWLPFCKKYNIKPICPKAYFEDHHQEENSSSTFVQHRKIVKEKYEIFKQRVHMWKVKAEMTKFSDGNISAHSHPANVQVINNANVVEDEDTTIINPENVIMPLLVYTAREKKPSHPHHFKAGALNVLLRVSSILSNSPYILVLDCDMYCNDSISARQAMCFYVDTKISPSLAWIQFPQKFHNVDERDIYDSQMRTTWPVLYHGMDGLQGPVLSGTNFFINRKALYGFDIVTTGIDIDEHYGTFGSSNDLIKYINQTGKYYNGMNTKENPCFHKNEAQLLASCHYEEHTQWGEKVGFRYHSVVEDVMTGFMIHSQGWKSVYLNPKSPQFLGSSTTNLNDALVQGSRWVVGLLQLGLSKYSPLFYNSPRILILQKMLYLWVAFFPIDFLPVLCLAIIPPISLFYGVSLYPKVSEAIIIPYCFVFVSSLLKQLFEVSISGGSVNSWMNEQRIAIIKCVTAYAYGSLECIMSNLGLREASFIPTNKAGDHDSIKWYQLGKYDFRTSNMFLVPIVTGVTLNILGFVGGLTRVIATLTWDMLFAQIIISLYVLILSFPIIEGMLLRKDNAGISFLTTLMTILLSSVILSLGYTILM